MDFQVPIEYLNYNIHLWEKLEENFPKFNDNFQ